MSSPQLVYIDASVFGYALLPHHEDKKASVKKAKDFLKDIEIGKYQGIISTITKIEFEGMAKRLISRALNRQITKAEEQTVMDDFDQYTMRLGIGLGDSDVLATDNMNSSLFRNATTIMKASFPYFHQTSSLWKNIGGTDALTVSFAIRLNVKLFATFDRGFNGLNNSSIKPLIIQDEY